MAICPYCNTAMKTVMRFSADKACKLFVCPTCRYEGKEHKLVYAKDCPYKDKEPIKEPEKKKKKKSRRKKNVRRIRNNHKGAT